ncbi:hypothetical protein Aduo_000677 [Ancylostoma duodenale]
MENRLIGDPLPTTEERSEDARRTTPMIVTNNSEGVEEIIIISTAILVVILALLIAALVMWWERKRRRERYEAYYGISTQRKIARIRKRRRRGKAIFARKQKLILPPEFRKPVKKKSLPSKTLSKEKGSTDAYGEQVTQEEIIHGEHPLSREKVSKGSEEKISRVPHEDVEEVTQSDAMIMSISQLTQIMKDQMASMTAVDEEEVVRKPREKQKPRSAIF